MFHTTFKNCHLKSYKKVPTQVLQMKGADQTAGWATPRLVSMDGLGQQARRSGIQGT